MVKIRDFPPGWPRFRFLMVLIWIPFLISPPNGQDLAEICSKCQLQFLRLMALPVIEESSYLVGNPDVSISSSFSFPRVITLPNVIHDSREKAGSQVRGVEFRSPERVLRKSSTRAVAVGQIFGNLAILLFSRMTEYGRLDGLCLGMRTSRPTTVTRLQKLLRF